jgi:hypothetical protein
MATSTSTLLEVINRVLTNANERTVTASTDPVGLQAKESIRMALLLLFGTRHWSFTQVRGVATSWITQQATLPTTTVQIRGVSYNVGDGILMPLKYLPPMRFDQYELTADTTALPARPLYYTIRDYNLVDVNPYPNDAAERAKVFFYTKSYIALPATDSATFSIPEFDVNLLVLKATELFTKRNDPDYMATTTEELVRVLAASTTMPATEYSLIRSY